jgi:hypothetical protein
MSINFGSVAPTAPGNWQWDHFRQEFVPDLSYAAAVQDILEFLGVLQMSTSGIKKHELDHSLSTLRQLGG